MLIATAANPAITEVLLNFEDELGVFSEQFVVHLEGVVDFRQLVGGREVGVERRRR